MKTYVGTKTLKAKPMTRQEYIYYRGWALSKDEDGSEEVYLVEYPVEHAIKPNHKNHKGYISMFTKKMFEKDYQSADTFKDRLIIDNTDLYNKIQKLTDFMDGDIFEGLKDYRKEDLKSQLNTMRDYNACLTRRIKDLI